MSWVIDSCVVLDVALKDSTFGVSSALFLEERRKDGLTVCPVTTVEIAPFFGGKVQNVREFLRVMGSEPMATWMDIDTIAAAEAWYAYVRLKRGTKIARRPVADILIGAFASRHDGLITRNPDHFSPFFPDLVLKEPPEVRKGYTLREPRAKHQAGK